MSFYQETIGYVIHQRNYSNSSLIIEFFSQDYGMIHVIAKGIKSNKRLRSQIQYFSSIKIQFYGKSNLKTLSSIDILKSKNFENIINNTAGLYLNELLHHSLVEFDKVDELYLCYQESIRKLGKGKLTPILRNFEMELLKHNGFELSESHDIHDTSWIGIDENIGISAPQKQQDQLCLHGDLKLIVSKTKPGNQAQKRINRFMMKAIDMSLNHRRLYSRELLISLTTNKSV